MVPAPAPTPTPLPPQRRECPPGAPGPGRAQGQREVSKYTATATAAVQCTGSVASSEQRTQLSGGREGGRNSGSNYTSPARTCGDAQDTGHGEPKELNSHMVGTFCPILHVSLPQLWRESGPSPKPVLDLILGKG